MLVVVCCCCGGVCCLVVVLGSVVIVVVCKWVLFVECGLSFVGVLLVLSVVVCVRLLLFAVHRRCLRLLFVVFTVVVIVC